jgi:hypothetical protein
MSTPSTPLQASSTEQLSNLKLFGRRYSLKVYLPTARDQQTVITLANNGFEPEALRITFDVQTVFFQTAWYATIDIYNLDRGTTTQLINAAGQTSSSNTTIKQGMTVSLSAGYQNGNYGEIFNGPVFQALFTRENVTDYKLTLHCMLWLDPMTRTSISSTVAAFTNQATIIEQIAIKAFGAGAQVNISPNINSTQLSRQKVIFGSASEFLDELANDNNMQYFLDSHGLNFARVDDNLGVTSSAQAKVFTSSTGLVGVPVQTQYGVAFRVLLDPTVKVQYPAQVVNIDNSQIVQLKKYQGDVPSVLDQSGNYIVFGARYIGDSRGRSWYTEIDGLTSVNGKMAAAQYLASKGLLNAQ